MRGNGDNNTDRAAGAADKHGSFAGGRYATSVEIGEISGRLFVPMALMSKREVFIVFSLKNKRRNLEAKGKRLYLRHNQ